jgi:ATP-dependent Lon protease
MEKQISKIMRKVAWRHLRGEVPAPLKLEAPDLKEYLGEPGFKEDRAHALDKPGLALGLAWTSLGGDVLTIECLLVPGGSGLRLTGKLGEVMSESANIAYSRVRSTVCGSGCDDELFVKNRLHLHVPAGATPKDGPSAGITMASAMLSLIRGKTLRPRLAMTGELSLSGDVLPIGGLKEKVIAAKRSGIREIIFPEANLADLGEIPEYVKKGLVFHPVTRMDEVEAIIFTRGKVEHPGTLQF